MASYRELKALARRADRAKGEKRKRLVEELIREIPKLDPFEGCDEFMVWEVAQWKSQILRNG